MEISNKLEELGYTLSRDGKYCKSYDSVRISLYAPSDAYLRKEWVGYLETTLCSYYDDDEQIKYVQTAFSIMKSDLKELNDFEEIR